MRTTYNQELLAFIEKHPTSYHVTAGQKELLDHAGYQQLFENDAWEIRPGGKYYVIRNGSAIAAFRIPPEDCAADDTCRIREIAEKKFAGFMIMASHSDSPSLKIKRNPEMQVDQSYTKLNVEPYGGLLMAPWFDRPLSVAGRIFVRTGTGMECRLVNLDRDLLVIPSLAIHMNREANKGYTYNAQKDLLPLYGMEESRPLAELLAEAAGVDAGDILDGDLYLYNRQPGTVFGANEEFLMSPRLDDVQCAFASLQGFLESEQDSPGAKEGNQPIPVHVVFDNEEVGSSTRQGAASTFLADTLERISEALGDTRTDYKRRIACSFMLSADNAHAVHPNHTDKADPVNHPHLNGGVVLKYSANQRYTTDGMSGAIVRLLAARAGVTLQEFHNRSDIPGGSTLGNISGNQAAVCTADIGIAQLAMHSPCETCGAEDTEQLVRLARELFASQLCIGEGEVTVCHG
ncbi:MAG: M18 family aminopeptidase [Eubacterium sp.]|nr:M18 family aminopeptidase [Eubacterium sp.]